MVPPGAGSTVAPPDVLGGAGVEVVAGGAGALVWVETGRSGARCLCAGRWAAECLRRCFAGVRWAGWEAAGIGSRRVTGSVAGTFAAVTGEYAPTYGAGGVTVRRGGGEETKSAPTVAAPAFTPAAITPAAVAAAKPAAAKAKPTTNNKPVKKAKKKVKQKPRR